MNAEKPWWRSKGAVANLVGTLAGIAVWFGVEVSPEQQQMIVDNYMGIVVAVINLVGLFGRLAATTTIRKSLF